MLAFVAQPILAPLASSCPSVAAYQAASALRITKNTLLAWALSADVADYRAADSFQEMRPWLLLRHITNAMLNAHKAMRTMATSLGIESNNPM